MCAWLRTGFRADFHKPPVSWRNRDCKELFRGEGGTEVQSEQWKGTVRCPGRREEQEGRRKRLVWLGKTRLVREEDYPDSVMANQVGDSD